MYGGGISEHEKRKRDSGKSVQSHLHQDWIAVAGQEALRTTLCIAMARERWIVRMGEYMCTYICLIRSVEWTQSIQLALSKVPTLTFNKNKTKVFRGLVQMKLSVSGKGEHAAIIPNLWFFTRISHAPPPLFLIPFTLRRAAAMTSTTVNICVAGTVVSPLFSGCVCISIATAREAAAGARAERAEGGVAGVLTVGTNGCRRILCFKVYTRKMMEWK